METETYKQHIAVEIRNEITRQRIAGKLTSKNERMSMASIGRTLDPPVHRVTVLNVVDGAPSQRVRDAIERELGKAYWIKRDKGQKAAQ
ncbi:MAG: hypothetical protein JW882_10005 [Deltaproteobacteria bacterium]|nr:hypothetical protein [Deltaproteobacteria bacterium]